MKGDPGAWKEAHSRLYEHYKDTAEELPGTVEKMAPLYAAVAHGCQAGRHQEALDDVFWGRIQRGREAFSSKKLGAFGAELAALSGFFDPPWRQPVAGLTEADQGFVLNEAGENLRALGRLSEAAQSMEAALQAAKSLKSWANGARAAGSLSKLYATIGDLAQAQAYAEHSVELAERSGDAFQRLARRTDLADALHQVGRLHEAESLFGDAEEMQKEREPKYPLIYSLQGYEYCDLLLAQGNYLEVQERARQTVGWEQGRLLDIALDHLSLGRAHLLEAQQEDTGDFTQAMKHMDSAVDGLRQAGRQDYIPRGLLARADLYRVRGDHDTAPRDLEEAMSIAERGGMGLHRADAHLEYARLYLALG